MPSGIVRPTTDFTRRERDTVYPWKLPPLPASMWWLGREPYPNGGYINRHAELPDHCPYYERTP